jgi:hypothetical protein
MRAAYDLTKALDELKRAGANSALIKGIRKFHAVTSVKIDLITTTESVDELQDTLRLSGNTRRVASALFLHAVVTYSRATHTNTSSRYNVGVTGAYDKEQLAQHKAITDLRDKCIAHFGYGVEWNDERAILRTENGMNAVTSAHMRSTYNDSVLASFNDLLSVALPHVTGLEVARGTELVELMNKTSAIELDIIRKFPFEPVRFYGGNPAAEEEFWRFRRALKYPWDQSRAAKSQS